MEGKKFQIILGNLLRRCFVVVVVIIVIVVVVVVVVIAVVIVIVVVVVVAVCVEASLSVAFMMPPKHFIMWSLSLRASRCRLTPEAYFRKR